MRKFFKNIAVWIMAVVLSFSGSAVGAVPAYAESESMPDITAKYYEAFDITAGQKLIGKRESKKMYPASITKVLFAEVLLDWLQENDRKVSDAAGTVTSKDNENAAAAGLYRSGLKAGEKVTWDDLLHSILYMSGAEACYAAARLSFGSEKKATEKMNEKAEQMGMKSSHFVNITGAHSASHYTTCEDYVNVMQAAWGNATLQKIFSSASYTTPDRKHTFRSPTSRAAAAGGSELIGGKTGTTDAAQHTFAGYARISGHIIVITVGLCPLSIASSNIRDAGSIAKFIRQNFELKKIPEKVSSGGTLYISQTKGQVLMRKGACKTCVRDGSIVMSSGRQEAVIPSTKAPEKKKAEKTIQKKKKENRSRGLADFFLDVFHFVIGLLQSFTMAG